ncbi:hypothetical protein L6164_006595 [Bauhinia variegata]|uniref:Uncharacterized protein n=1 Tax=Bauhinia variegata TaxID=167791 RepID=A0ACB9PUD0_BAUVA|nr:hypothetical protein L6164_006595 [Bauhinia variegata]
MKSRMMGWIHMDASYHFSISFIELKHSGFQQTRAKGMENFPNEAVIYVLGGPGSGKGTQCSNIVENFGFCHLSTGELLEVEANSTSEYGTMIQEFKKEGKLLPSEIVIKLLQKAMEKSEVKGFLIDGFPRNQENLTAAEDIMKIEPDLVLYFECTEEELTRRLLNRNQGRADDNIDTIKKRLQVYFECTLPVIDYYTQKDKVHKIDAEKPVEEVFEAVKCALSMLKG